jgi:hypothetical protein
MSTDDTHPSDLAAAMLAALLPHLGDATRDAHAWRLERAAVVRELQLLYRDAGLAYPHAAELADVIEAARVEIALERDRRERVQSTMRGVIRADAARLLERDRLLRLVLAQARAPLDNELILAIETELRRS